MNDEAPWFESSEFEAQIKENQPAGTSILKVSALDRDHGERSLITLNSNVKCVFLSDSKHSRICDPCLKALPSA